MEYIRAVRWWALIAVLLGAGAIIIAVVWPERGLLALIIAVVSLMLAVLSLKEATGEEDR